MVIDDTDVDLYISELVLKKYNFAEEVVMMESAENALAYLKEVSENKGEFPQLIFLDIRMPEMDGFGFLEEYAKLTDSAKSKSVIMMLSTSLNTDDHEKARANPYVKKFLDKPLNKEMLDGI